MEIMYYEYSFIPKSINLPSLNCGIETDSTFRLIWSQDQTCDQAGEMSGKMLNQFQFYDSVTGNLLL